MTYYVSTVEWDVKPYTLTQPSPNVMLQLRCSAPNKASPTSVPPG